jgi:hypothetical protein
MALEPTRGRTRISRPLAIFAEAGLVVDETSEAMTLVLTSVIISMSKWVPRQKYLPHNNSPWPAFADYCKDFAELPKSWMGLPKDLVPGEKSGLLPALPGTLIDLGLSRKTIGKHVDNLGVVGGEMIHDLRGTPSLRKYPSRLWSLT